MSSTQARPATEHPSPARVDGLTWKLAVANLAAQIGIIVTGGAVRLTGSGLGCSTWPMCEPGSFTPQFHAEMGIHPIIEFGNRTLTGVLTIIAIALLWAVLRREPTASRPTSIKVLAALPLVGIAVQAVVGGLTVLVDLHPGVVGSHMFISLALVAVSAQLLVRLRGADAPARWAVPRPLQLLAQALVVVGVVLLVLGVVTTGAGPHAGDADEPYRWALDPAFISRLHALSVWAFVGLLAACLVLLRRTAPDRTRAWWVLLAVTALQGVIGYVQYFTGLPELLVGLHMLGAGLLIVALVYALDALVTRERAAVAAA